VEEVSPSKAIATWNWARKNKHKGGEDNMRRDKGEETSGKRG
jgi:hypothetical protein